jgi:hypothetical protein
MPNSTTFRKNWSRFWSWVSPPWTANDRNGLPSLRARLGVSVARGRLPGSITLNGFSAGSSTKLCARCDSPMPVRPAITAGTHPPLGVIETTHPVASAACTDVVPSVKVSSRSQAGTPPPAPVVGFGGQASR